MTNPKTENSHKIITYRISEDSSRPEEDFVITLEKTTLRLDQPVQEPYPQWVKLNCEKCSICPLSEDEHPFCPVAINVFGAIDFFSRTYASEDLLISVITDERTYQKRTNFKTAASSVLGIFMAASGCPVLDKLRPMLLFHLPFANAVETAYRSVTAYLMAQYLLSINKKDPDWELKEFTSLYEDIETVNESFRARLQQSPKNNYAVIANMTLDSFANFQNITFDSESFDHVRMLFTEFFTEETAPLSAQAADGVRTITTQYQFTFEDGSSKIFSIDLNEETLELVRPTRTDLPEWTQLGCKKCPCCPLKETAVSHCPAATGLIDVIDLFRSTQSTQKAAVTVKTKERSYLRNLPVAESISSLIGLIMASSGCPVLRVLKPMVRNHLPFATVQETIYRSIGIYLLAQYFLLKKGEEADWELKKLPDLFAQINEVNPAFCERLRTMQIEDANLNALVDLDCFSRFTRIKLSKKDMDDLQQLFGAYLS